MQLQEGYLYTASTVRIHAPSSAVVMRSKLFFLAKGGVLCSHDFHPAFQPLRPRTIPLRPRGGSDKSDQAPDTPLGSGPVSTGEHGPGSSRLFKSFAELRVRGCRNY